MRMRFENASDLAEKVDYEGGLYEAIYYGINAEQLPPDTPSAVFDAWSALEAAMGEYGPMIQEWLAANLGGE